MQEFKGGEINLPHFCFIMYVLALVGHDALA